MNMNTPILTATLPNTAETALPAAGKLLGKASPEKGASEGASFQAALNKATKTELGNLSQPAALPAEDMVLPEAVDLTTIAENGALQPDTLEQARLPESVAPTPDEVVFASPEVEAEQLAEHPAQDLAKDTAEPTAAEAGHQPTELIKSVLGMAFPGLNKAEKADKESTLSPKLGNEPVTGISTLAPVTNAPQSNSLQAPKNELAQAISDKIIGNKPAQALASKEGVAVDTSQASSNALPESSRFTNTLSQTTTQTAPEPTLLAQTDTTSASTQVANTHTPLVSKVDTPSQVSSTTPTLQAALEPENPEWGTQLGKHLVQMHLKGDQTMELKLHPADLGPLSATIRVNEMSQAQVHFVTQNPQVRQALEHAFDQLRGALAQEGLQLADSSVSDQRGGQGQQFSDQHSESRWAITAQETETTAPLSGNTVRSGQAGEINIYA